MSRVANTGPAANFTQTNTVSFQLMAEFVTDANDPGLLSIPAGSWNFSFYFSASNNSNNPQFYVELLKYDGTTFTSIATGVASPETITNGTTIDLYNTSITIPSSTALTLTDRLVIKVYVDTDGNRTVTFYTQATRLAEVFTTFTTGLTALNGLTAQVQTFATGTSGTDFGINSTTNTHTFNIPDASDTARGLITTGAQTLAGIKTFGNGTSAGELRLLEGSGGGTDYVAIKSPAIISSSSYSLTLPTNNPGSGQVMVSDGSGNLTWSSNPGTTSNQFLRAFGGTATGTTSENIVQSLLVPAGTFNTSSGWRIFAWFSRSVATNITMRIYVNTSNTIGGFNLASTGWLLSGNPTADYCMERIGFVQVPSGVTRNTVYFSGAVFTTYTSSGVFINSAIDWSIDQYFILTVVSGTTGNVTTCRGFQLMPT